MGHDVFISYSRHASSAAAVALRDRLAERGITGFLDVSNLDVGEEFPQELADGILDARIVVLVLSNTYFERWYCLRELRTALGPYDFATQRAERDDDALTRSLRSLIVLLPDDAVGLDQLPRRLSNTNWPHVAEMDRLVELVEERLAAGTPQLRQQLEEMQAYQLLQGFREAAAVPPPTDDSTLFRYHSSPPERSLEDQFAGRADDLERLHRRVSPRESDNGGRSFSAVRVVGMAGFGKTRFVTEYVWRYGRRYYPGGVYWIEAKRSPSSLEEQLYEIARSLHDGSLPALATLRREKADIRRVLADACRASTTIGQALFVVDDVPSESPPRSLHQFCPVVGYTTVIATSQQTTQEPGIEILELGTLPREASLLVLTHDLGVASAISPEEWGELAAWVGDMPLALEQMHGALADGAIPPEKMLALARQPRGSTSQLDSFVEALQDSIPEEYRRSVSALFSATVDALDDRSRAAAKVLAQLAPAAIPEEIVDALGADLMPPRTRNQLRTRHIVSPGSSGIFGRMHPLMNDFLARVAGADEEPWMRACDSVLQVMAPELIRDPEAWPLMSRCEPHASHLFETGTDETRPFGNTPRQKRAVQVGLRSADLLRARGDVIQSDRVVTRVHGGALTQLNDPYLEVEALYSYCRTREDLGQWDEVLSSLEMLFFYGRFAVGMDNEYVLHGKLMQARVHIAKGDLGAALASFTDLKRVQDEYASAGLPFPIDRALMNETTAQFWSRAGEQHRAAEDHLRALRLYEEREPAHSDNVLRSKANYAQDLRDLGGPSNLQRAMEMLTEIRNVLLSRFGSHYRGTIIATSNLAGAYNDLGMTERASELWRECLRDAEAALGPEHHDTREIRRRLSAASSG
jgi:hypothetical protein